MNDHRKKVAIVGAGISGLYTAYLLKKKYQVTVFEKNESVGGHTATKKVTVDSGEYCIDTGFIVYNDRTYPNFIRLLDQLGVAGQDTAMGFSVACDDTGYAYAGTSISGLFAQPKNIVKPSHWSLLADIVRFNKLCTSLYHESSVPADATLASFLRDKGFSRQFEKYYILPMVSAIWSSGTEIAEQMPLQFFIHFFHNHGLLTVFDQPQWRTVQGGSHSYLEPLTRDFSDNIVTSSSIETIRRDESGVLIRENGSDQRFDAVVLACHSNEALTLLEAPSSLEKSILGAIPYKKNHVVLHTDDSILPEQHAAWASWNYRVKGDKDTATLLTYNMNILQNIQAPETFCVTVNPNDRLRSNAVLGEYEYYHPVFTHDSVAAQKRWSEISGVDNTYFCGAYWRNGFHEDGVVSAINVAKQLGVDL